MELSGWVTCAKGFRRPFADFSGLAERVAGTARGVQHWVADAAAVAPARIKHQPVGREGKASAWILMAARLFQPMQMPLVASTPTWRVEGRQIAGDLKRQQLVFRVERPAADDAAGLEGAAALGSEAWKAIGR